MSGHYVAHLDLADDQQSNYSTLSGALTPTIMPQYALPQAVYHPVIRQLPAGSMKPILFHSLSGAPWVSLPALRADPAELAHTIVDGSDIIFQGPLRKVTIEFHIMWPGYDDFDIPQKGTCLKFFSQTTTRAMLAKIIGSQIDFFMEDASRIHSAPRLYKIGHDGIRSDQVLLGGIENTYAGIWQAKLYIDNSKHL